MAEMTKEEAKKDLKNLVDKSKTEIEKNKEAKMSPEEKKKVDADKAEDQKKQETADVQAKRDKEILEASEEDLKDSEKFNDAERTRKQELLDKQKKAEDGKLSPQLKKVKEETQKRIDEISNNLLQLKDSSSKEAEDLRSQLKTVQDEKVALEEKLTKPKDDINSIIKKEEDARATKYLDDDKDKPREQRREMSEEEWDAWFLEEPRKATAWESRQENRRTGERQHIHTGLVVNEIKAKQGDSVGRVWTKHPELNTLKREAELKAEGKDVKETHDILCKENEKYKVFHQSLAKLQSRNSYADNLPELVMADMEKQLGAAPVVDTKQEQIDSMTKTIEELTATVQQLQTGDTGINSNLRALPKAGELTPDMKQFVQTAKEMGLPQENIDKRLAEMKKG